MERIDIRGAINAMAILQIEALMRQLPAGGRIEVLCDDEAFIGELLRVRADYACERLGPSKDGKSKETSFVIWNNPL